MRMASPLPLTPVPALRSLPSVALSSDTVKSNCMIPFWLVVFKRPAGRLLWPGLAGNYGPAGRGKRLYADVRIFDPVQRKVPVVFCRINSCFISLLPVLCAVFPHGRAYMSHSAEFLKLVPFYTHFRKNSAESQAKLPVCALPRCGTKRSNRGQLCLSRVW